MSIPTLPITDDLPTGSWHRNLAKLMIVCAGLIALLANPSWAQRPPGLPGENELPGTASEATTLPSESALPGDDPADAADLPGEDRIAGSEKSAGVGQVAGHNESTPISGKAPILRLAFDGHIGTVRTLDISDGGRTLVTAGEDKDVHVWRRTDIGDTGWLHRRTIRWPVTRGPRGLIYAARLKEDLVAFAGYGAFGSKGEIRIVDAASGELKETLVNVQNGHLSNVLSLAWSPENRPRLASIDREGRLVVWEADVASGIWRGKTLVQVDEKTYGANISAALKQAERRSFVPVTFVGANYLVVPRYVGPTADPKGFANWHLQRVDLRDGKSVVLNNLDHIRHVRAFSATDDGRVLASCDWGGSIGLWTFDGNGAIVTAKNFKPEAPPLFIDLDSNGKWLLVGTELAGKKPNLQAKLQLWDVEANPPQLLSERALSDNVRACALDDDHREAIVTQGNEIEIYPFNVRGKFSDDAPKLLTVPAKPVLKVAFARVPGSYKIAFGWNRNETGEKMFEGVFDLSESKLQGRGPIDAANFLEPQRTAVRWLVDKPLSTPQGVRYQLFEEDQPRSILPLSRDRHGWPLTVCTLPALPTRAEDSGEKPATGAVIVGTDGEYGIYAYRANASKPPELLRQFRDHSGNVNSVSTSADGRYLVSGAGDATISVWNLQDIYSASTSVNKWGTDFEIEGNQLIATNVREDGPLYFRGVRGGDRLVSIEWTDNDATLFAESNSVKMRERLLNLPFDLLVHFKFARLGRLGPDFQSLPAWRPLATLFVDQSREWAFWTPAGYYDASFNGHQRFGWQINNNVDQPVEYYRAAQFRKTLERPDLMRRLLAAGSLPAAMRQTITQIGPSPGDGAIVNQIQNRPKIRLVSPSAGDVIEGDSMTVRAEITVPVGAILVESKAFVSGVPAIDRTIVSNRGDAAPGVITYQWQFRLPSDQYLQLELLAATEAEAFGRVLIDLEHNPSDTPRMKPRLHVLAIGASQYRDPQIQSLDFAADAAGKVSDLFRAKSSSLYRTSADQLVNTDATRPLWRVFAQSAAEQLSETVSPDDLVVMYLCGHGLRDRRTDQWYFVTADARYSDLMNDQYGDCIAFSDLAALSKLPCRKLAILDSCHSGAVQPLMRSGDLKSALRFLQDDVVLILTASEGDEEAAEQRETRLGRFTATLVDALNGEADKMGNDDGTVTLSETIDYVTRRVAKESEREGMPQHPTASPHYLLRTLRLPLTSTDRP